MDGGGGQQAQVWREDLDQLPEAFYLGGQGTRSLSVFFCVCMAALTALVSTGSYARKETISGFVAPSQGSVTFRSTRSGRIKIVHVSEGQLVGAGAPVVTIAVDESVSGGRSVGGMLAEASKAQFVALAEQRAAEKVIQQRDVRELEVKAASLHAQAESLRKSQRLANERLALARERLERAKPLFDRGFVSGLQIQQWRDELLQTEIAASTLEQQAMSLQASLGAVDLDLNAASARATQSLSGLDAARATVEEKLASALGSQEIVLRAERTGRISGLRAEVGGAVTADEAVAVLLPPGGAMEVQLWAPSRSVGLIRVGDKVKVSYDAFPYQSFGFARGSIAAVEATPSSPPGLDDGVHEPRYRIRVRLARNAMTANGRDWPLVAGMKATGLVTLERRSLFSWLVAPAGALRARLQE
ncbi:MAG: HlyD family efflux transporter periplasmic adaptor subunit [Caulobacter sp.]|nr:HlyD family efflux transporter periplasmic adaptor subunit [Caulobacter sp.]